MRERKGKRGVKLLEERITFRITIYDFKSFVGREPKDEKEFKSFVNLVRKGLDKIVDFEVILSLAAEEFADIKAMIEEIGQDSYE